MKDNLTQLYDRETFFNILDEQIASVHKNKSQLALLVIDINRFERINLLYGYSTGDQVLKLFAQVLNRVKRKQDFLARIGDNRFAFILVDILNTGHASLAAHKILRLLETPFKINNELLIEAAIGISLYPLHAEMTENLLKESEAALISARHKKQHIGISNTGEGKDISETWDIEADINKALETQQFSVYYQPQISLSSGKPVGAEALIRWNHPTRGFIPRNSFIPVAEQTGHIKAITNLVLNSALRHSLNWTKKWGPLSVSVNIPPELIYQMALKDYIEHSFSLWGNNDITLILEIIERSLVQDTEQSFVILKQLQSIGVQISIDDFGTGYSSLAYFKSLPVNEIKIDKSFIDDLLTNTANEKLIQIMIELAHNFNLKVVAEGIETKEIYKTLANMGCDIGQGYYMAKPLPEKEFETWLENFNSSVTVI